MPVIKDKIKNAVTNRISKNRIKGDVSSSRIEIRKVQSESHGLSRLPYRKVYSCTWTRIDKNCG
ncbi:MAG: hypothetical protein GF315_01155 [candidate division Zixibacteria bacterium]|nr:hypothetical protein [candidate division Zixibacteria bacterium]